MGNDALHRNDAYFIIEREVRRGRDQLEDNEHGSTKDKDYNAKNGKNGEYGMLFSCHLRNSSPIKNILTGLT